MDKIEKKVLDWHKETFPNATDFAVWNKCQEEIRELFYAGSYGNEYLSEVADVIITNMALINKMSAGSVSICDVIEWKLDINKSRKWGKEDLNGDRPRIK